MRLLLALLLLLLFTFAAPVSAAKVSASCSVSPNPVGANEPATVTVTANVGFDFYLTDPTGGTWTFPQGPAGTRETTFDVPPISGDWKVTIRNTHYPHPKAIGGCSFVVTP